MFANVTLALERCCVTKMRFTRACMGTLRVSFEAVLKHFQQVTAGGGIPLRKKTRLAGSESNHRTAKAKIFSRNGRSRFKSQSAEA